MAETLTITDNRTGKQYHIAAEPLADPDDDADPTDSADRS